MTKSSIKSTDKSKQGGAVRQNQKSLRPEAQRALAEAEARHEAQKISESDSNKSQTKEIGGRKGPDPVRFGDWEKDGIVSDF